MKSFKEIHISSCYCIQLKKKKITERKANILDLSSDNNIKKTC